MKPTTTKNLISHFTLYKKKKKLVKIKETNIKLLLIMNITRKVNMCMSSALLLHLKSLLFLQNLLKT